MNGGHGPLPTHRHRTEGRELELVAESLASGATGAGGPFSREAAEQLRSLLGAAGVLLTTSCTAALEMTALLLEVGPGDSVVVPSFGFVSAAQPFALRGATIRFCDIERTTFGLDPDHLATLVDASTRAVVPIHYAGVGCDVDAISSVLASWPRAEMVEDNAHGPFGSIAGRPLGGFGRFSVLSFHETKTFSCGEGGALVLNDARDEAAARVILDKGTDRSAFLAGAVDRYTWQGWGASFGLSDILAAVLLAQLEQRDAIAAHRRRVAERYRALLQPIQDDLGLTVPAVPDDRVSADHLFPVLASDRAHRDRLISGLRGHGVGAAFHYQPLHRSPRGRLVARQPVDCPVSDEISDRLLRLPLSTSVSVEDAEWVVEALASAGSS